MARRSLTCTPDHVLLLDLSALVSKDRGLTAELLEHIAEVDDRKLRLPAGLPSMFRCCVVELHMSEDAAYLRIRAARAAREFPVILDMVQDGRLHLTAIVHLARQLTPENSAELLAAGAGRTKAELEQLLAERFPSADVPTRLEAGTPPCDPAAARATSSAEPVAVPASADRSSNLLELVPEPVVPAAGVPTPQPVAPLPARPRLAPIAPERFALQVTLTRSTHDKLRRSQELLSHAVPSGNIAEVLDRALDALISQLEKRKFAAPSRPGPRRLTENTRHIPAHVRRAVHERDGNRCTCVSDDGRRCAEKRFLDHDHVHPVARGGGATFENTRLRCRAHNQYAAERTFGARFMREKREAAKATTQATRMRRAARDQASGGCDQ